VPLRHIRAEHLERLYADLLEHGRARGPGGLDAKTVHEIHTVLHRALGDAVRRGILIRNPAELAHTPKRRPMGSAEMRCWNADQLNEFLRAASSHPLYAVFWLAANTGMHRGELLGRRWHDIDLDACRLSVNRSLVSVGYELHESRGKTRNSRRSIDLDPRTVQVLDACRARTIDGSRPVFCRADGGRIHPPVVSDAFKRLVARSDLPRFASTICAIRTPLSCSRQVCPIKVVSERLGQATPGFTMATHQHALPGMQQEAARTFAAILDPSTGSTLWNTR
jgi:integrase